MKPSAGGIQGLIEKAAPTLAATAAISQAVGIPTMAASGIRCVVLPWCLVGVCHAELKSVTLACCCLVPSSHTFGVHDSHQLARAEPHL